MYYCRKNLAFLSATAGALTLGFAASAQPPSPPAAPAPAEAQPRRSHGKQPYFVEFDVEKRIFYRRCGENGKQQIITGGFVIRPNDLVYFRATNYNPSKLKVKVTYQPVPPQRVTLPNPFTTFLASVSTADTAGSATPGSDNAADPGTVNVATANQLLDLLASAVKEYKPKSNSVDDIGAAIQAVQDEALTNLQAYLQADPTAKSSLPQGLDITKLTKSDGVHIIYLIAAEKARKGEEEAQAKGYSEPKKVYDKVYARYMKAADLWRNIDAGTFLDTAIGPEVADDTVGQMAFKVEISDATAGDNAAANPYNLTIQKHDSRNIEFAVSANVVGSLLRDEAYYKGSDAKGTIQRQSRDDFNVTTGAFVHTLFGSPNQQVRFGLSVGLTPETTPKFMVGGSLLAGHDQRIILTAGVISGKVARLGNGLQAGVDPVPADGNIPTQSVMRSAFFFSVGFKF